MALDCATSAWLQSDCRQSRKWGDDLRVRVDYQTQLPEAGESLFNLSIRDGQTGTVERFVNLSVDPLHPRFAVTVLARESDLRPPSRHTSDAARHAS